MASLTPHDMIAKTRYHLNLATKWNNQADTSLTPPAPVPDPSPSPTPDPTPPPVSPLPDKTNTGPPPRTEFKPWSGQLTDRLVLDGVTITGQISVPSGVRATITNSLFEGDGSPYAVLTRGGTILLDHCEFRGNYQAAAIAFDGWTAQHCNFWGLPADGCKLGDNAHLSSSWIHDFVVAPGNHADGVQVQNGIVNSSAVGNNIYGCNNAAIFVSPDLGPTTDGPLDISRNHLDDGNYTLYVVDGNNKQYYIHTINVDGNMFGRHSRYGAIRVNVPVNWSGNAYADNGEPILNL